MLSEECMEELMRRFGVVMDAKVEGLARKDDLVAINKEIAELRTENASLRSELDSMREDMGKMSRQLDLYGRDYRRNNLIFSGLQYDASSDLHSVISDFVTRVLGVSPAPMIGSLVKLGRDNTSSPILVKFLKAADVFAILGKTSRLKGTGYGVSRDYVRT
uniref:Argininosuccinate lyase n=1 Tax=Lygus hesperus TaxID=30085 RepID=A0A0A9XLJ7_LYGHE